jgi:predicted permease
VSAFGMPALDAVVLAAALAAILGTTIVFALAPAIRLSRSNLTDDLRSGDRAGARHARGLSWLATTQVAIAVLLLCISGMLVGAVAALQQRRVGYDPERVLTFWVRPPVSRYNYPQDGPAIISRLLASVQAVGGVESAAVNRCAPFGGCARSTVLLPDRPADLVQAPVVGRHYVSADYFRTLGIRLVAGRTLTDADRAGSAPVTVVSETAARRFWPGDSAVGKRVLFGNAGTPFSDPSRPVEVVGVVADVKYEGADQPDAETRGEFYTSYLQFSYPDTMVIVKGRTEAAALVGPLRRAVAAVDESLPIFDVLTLDERIDASLDRPRFTMVLLTGFGVTSMLLAALGMYGVLSSAVSARLRELGVRIALGASRRRIVGMVMGQGLTSAVFGVAAGVLAAWLAMGVLRLVEVDGTLFQWQLLGGLLVLTCGVCAVAAYLPARRAAAADPIVVLRAE